MLIAYSYLSRVNISIMLARHSPSAGGNGKSGPNLQDDTISVETVWPSLVEE